MIHPGKSCAISSTAGVGQFSNDGFAKNHVGAGIKAWTVTYEDAARNIDLLASRLANVLSELKSL